MFAKEYLKRATIVLDLMVTDNIDVQIDELALELKNIRDAGGRLFIMGVGGSAAAASHAVGDFRKLDDFEAYTPTDNVYELTARTNDIGWNTIFSDWLKGSKLNPKDGLLILSVGGGDTRRNLSVNLINAALYGKQIYAKVFAILGRDGGEIIKIADKTILIPKPSRDFITPLTESIQTLILHLLVFHHHLRKNSATW
jgi:D-sedoheptulose 7-phosphate isomerase